MIIDIHTHLGDFRRPCEMDHTPVTVDSLIRRLDAEGIDRAVLLPHGFTPESTGLAYLFSDHPGIVDQIKAVASFTDRIIPFGNLDPRMGYFGDKRPDYRPVDFSWTLERFVEMGCVGIGEITANVPFDDPLVVNMMEQCGKWDLPVLFHGTGPGPGLYGLIDEAGSPRLERLLQQVPGTTFIGHATGFWAEVDGNITSDTKSTYPPGPITKEGSLPRLLRTYANLFADISANSGYNAISRDRDFGIRFLNEFQDKILYGTDVTTGDKRGAGPHLTFLKELLHEGSIDQAVFDKITSGNTLRLLKRYSG